MEEMDKGTYLPESNLLHIPQTLSLSLALLPLKTSIPLDYHADKVKDLVRDHIWVLEKKL